MSKWCGINLEILEPFFRSLKNLSLKKLPEKSGQWRTLHICQFLLGVSASNQSKKSIGTGFLGDIVPWPSWIALPFQILSVSIRSKTMILGVIQLCNFRILIQGSDRFLYLAPFIMQFLRFVSMITIWFLSMIQQVSWIARKQLPRFAKRSNPSSLVVIHDFEVQAYRLAAKAFPNSYRFFAFNPDTAILWEKREKSRR